MAKKRIHFKMTLFSGAVLALLLIGIFFEPHFAQRELFDEKNPITLYVKTETGEEPKLDFAEFFADRDYEYEEFECDLSLCDLDTPGTYEAPVYYKGELTQCTVKLQVGSAKASKKAVGSGIRQAEEK